jgi:hypothetical protein
MGNLAARGVVLALVDGALKAGPRAAITPEVRDLIRANRESLKRALAAPDIGPGWRERQGIDQWRAEWTQVWREWRGYLELNPEWTPPEPYELRCRIHERVADWNRRTGQNRHGSEVLACLCPEDFRDRELMQPGALALYVGSIFGRAGKSDPVR